MKFGNLTVISTTKSKAICKCACGAAVELWKKDLVRGHHKSCGCSSRRGTAEANVLHGEAARGNTSPEYTCWARMKSRCIRPQDPAYLNYGGRGISVCERWLNSFPNFLTDMGRRPSPEHSIDRIDNNGNYEPTNCRWATREQQARNKRSNILIEYQGKRQTLAEWAKDVGIPKGVLWDRIRYRNWPIERALSEPKKGGAGFCDYAVANSDAAEGGGMILLALIFLALLPVLALGLILNFRICRHEGGEGHGETSYPPSVMSAKFLASVPRMNCPRCSKPAKFIRDRGFKDGSGLVFTCKNEGCASYHLYFYPNLCAKTKSATVSGWPKTNGTCRSRLTATVDNFAGVPRFVRFLPKNHNASV